MAEHFPQSSAPSAMQTTVKVSLDEWAMLRHGGNAELMTDGLAGCVAIAIRTDNGVALTHVYSDAYTIARDGDKREDRFDAYKADVGKFVASIGDRDAIREMHLVENGHRVSAEREASLAGMIRSHLVDTGAVHADRVRLHDNSGCAISETGFFLKREDRQSLYTNGYTNTELERLPVETAGPIDARLRHGTFDCSQARPGPADIETPPRTEAAPGHLPAARYVAPVRAPEPEPEAQPALRTPKDAMFDQIVPSLRGAGFGMSSSHLARDLASQAEAHGFTAVEKVGIAKETNRITLEGNGGTLEFTASGRNATLVPRAEVPRIDGAASSSGLPLSPPPLSSPQPSVAQSSSPPPSPYAQALLALEPYREGLKLQDPGHASEAAREIASQAHRDGLTAINRLELVGQDRGAPALVAHQDGPSAKQSQPMPVETLQQHAGVLPPAQSQSGPDKSLFPIM